MDVGTIVLGLLGLLVGVSLLSYLVFKSLREGQMSKDKGRTGGPNGPEPSHARILGEVVKSIFHPNSTTMILVDDKGEVSVEEEGKEQKAEHST